MPRLTSLANVKSYLAIKTLGQDDLIEQLIPRESAVVERFTSRKFPMVQRVGVRLNGTGSDTLTLPDFPILSVDALSVCGTAVLPSDWANSPNSGYVFNSTCITLLAAKFPEGRANVLLSWTAGYRTTGNVTLAANANANITTIAVDAQALSCQADDVGFAVTSSTVVDASGSNAPVTFTAVAPGANLPGPAQFTFVEGVWTFNVAQANLPVSITFAYAPADVEQSVIEMVGLDLKQRDNLGVNSKSLAGESISYEKAGISLSVKQMLQPYRRMTPN